MADQKTKLMATVEKMKKIIAAAEKLKKSPAVPAEEVPKE
ncbi:hypothetical protein ES703_78372 [subsurface metagenome]